MYAAVALYPAVYFNQVAQGQRAAFGAPLLVGAQYGINYNNCGNKYGILDITGCYRNGRFEELLYLAPLHRYCFF
ncbi:MAG: hypothetical protein EOO39_31595 [Cytophagaceae bacterium]|nr:MAG: hypothetical protein EOO39_31595 [Cytophagaceae bacterium]